MTPNTESHVSDYRKDWPYASRNESWTARQVIAPEKHGLGQGLQRGRPASFLARTVDTICRVNLFVKCVCVCVCGGGVCVSVSV